MNCLLIFLCRGQYFDKHLKFIKLNEKKVPFTEKDLSYLLKVCKLFLKIFFRLTDCIQSFFRKKIENFTNTVKRVCAFHTFQSNYDETFAKTVYGAPLLTLSQVLTGAQPEHRTVRVQYSDKQSFKTQAKALGIMEDLKVSANDSFWISSRGDIRMMRVLYESTCKHV